MWHYTDWVTPILDKAGSLPSGVPKHESDEVKMTTSSSFIISPDKVQYIKPHKIGRKVFLSSGRQGQKSIGVRLRLTKSSHSHPFFTNEGVLLAISTDLERVIREAEFIRDLEHDWDQEGGLPVPSALLDASISFVREYYSFLFNGGINIPVPDIDPVRNGSVDILWHTKKARLLVNFRYLDGSPYAFFYGDCYENKSQLKGSFSPSSIYEPLAYWMKKLV